MPFEPSAVPPAPPSSAPGRSSRCSSIAPARIDSRRKCCPRTGLRRTSTSSLLRTLLSRPLPSLSTMRARAKSASSDPHVHFAPHLSATSQQHLHQARSDRLSTAVASRLRIEAEVRGLVNLIKLQGPRQGISRRIQDQLVALQAAKAEEQVDRAGESDSRRVSTSTNAFVPQSSLPHRTSLSSRSEERV